MSAALSISELVDQYLAAAAYERGSSAHTLRAYERELRNFSVYIVKTLGPQVAVDHIEHQKIRGYLSELYGRGLSKASVARALAAIRSWFKWLARQGYVEQNPAALVATPGADHRGDESRCRFCGDA
jgi:integrase/recombinase XerC